MWVGESKLKDRFPRLFHLERVKDVCVKDKGVWMGGEWSWKWDWLRDPRGRACGEMEDLLMCLQNCIGD